MSVTSCLVRLRLERRSKMKPFRRHAAGLVCADRTSKSIKRRTAVGWERRASSFFFIKRKRRPARGPPIIDQFSPYYIYTEAMSVHSLLDHTRAPLSPAPHPKRRRRRSANGLSWMINELGHYYDFFTSPVTVSTWFLMSRAAFQLTWFLCLSNLWHF